LGPGVKLDISTDAHTLLKTRVKLKPEDEAGHTDISWEIFGAVADLDEICELAKIRPNRFFKGLLDKPRMATRVHLRPFSFPMCRLRASGSQVLYIKQGLGALPG
jgi:hypothetical protein